MILRYAAFFAVLPFHRLLQGIREAPQHGAPHKTTRQWEFQVSVSNLFDKMAPLEVQTYGQIN
jgi:hypothetical protein